MQLVHQQTVDGLDVVANGGAGKPGPVKGSGVLLGDEECPLPNSSVATRNQRVVSSARPGPISQSLSWWSAM